MAKGPGSPASARNLSTPGALFRNRLLDLLLADSLQLLVLRGAKNFLQLRCALIVDGAELFHFLHWRKRRIVLDRFEFGTLFLEDRQHLHLLLWREFELLRQRLHLRCRVGGLARRGGCEDQKRKKAGGGRQERERFSHDCIMLGNASFAYGTKVL
jgi:hypothetical protein